MLFVIASLCMWGTLCVGLFRIRHLDTSFSIFCIYLIIGVGFDSATYIVKELSTRNILQDGYALISTILMVFVLDKWRRKKDRPHMHMWIIITMTTIMLFDFLSRPVDKPKIPWGYMMCLFIVILQAIRSLSEELTFGTGPWYRQSRILILLPLITSYLYFILLMLIISVLYDKHSAPILETMFKLMTILSLFKHFLFTFALIWAPRKERYL